METKDTDFAVVYAPVLNALGVIIANFEDIKIILPKIKIHNQTNSLPVF